MRLILTVLLSLLTGHLYAQQITGLLMGEGTRMPLAHATIMAGNTLDFTNAEGIFSVKLPDRSDSVRIRCAGYNYYAFKPAARSTRDTLIIYMKPVSYQLKEVVVRGNRNFKADSARTRKDFANVFTYKAPTVMDALYKRASTKYIPDDHITNQHSTSALLGVDVLSVVSLLSKKKDHTTKLQKILLQDESANYIDQSFSTEKVQDITSLKGDSLRNFMDRYRPGIVQVKKMSGYEMSTYIKKCYAEYVSSH